MVEKKITMKDRFNELKGIVVAAGVENEAELIEFLDKQIEKIDKKAEKAAETRAKKAAENDKLLEVVFNLVTNEEQTGDEIAAQIEDEEVTVAKVRNRLTKLVAAERIVKVPVKREGADGKTLKKMGYTLPAEDNENEGSPVED